ncbi:MAG: hypothetical protein LBI14_02340 [Treponema sp.]|nr:hypothetical protein [Treponema sp.]
MKKKTWLLAAFTAVLIIAALVVGCINPMGTSISDGISSPPGTGSFRLSLASGARTAIPSAGSQALGEFPAYVLVFTPVTPAATPPGTLTTRYVAYSATVTAAAIPFGTYDVTVTSYTTANGMSETNPPTGPALTGSTETPVIINAATGATGSVTLSPQKLAGTSGTFSYTITNQVTSLKSASLDIRTAVGTPSGSATPLSGLGPWNGTPAVTVGVRYAVLTLVNADDREKSIMEVLDIYSGLPSGPWTPTIPAGYFPVIAGPEEGEADITLTVTAIGPHPMALVVSGDIVNLPKTTSATTTAEITNASDYTGINWFINGAPAGTGATLFIEATDYTDLGYYQVLASGVATTANGGTVNTVQFVINIQP